MLFQGPTRLKLTKPVIGAIEGLAVAGGMELALMCDLRVVAEDMKMGIFNRRFGKVLVLVYDIKPGFYSSLMQSVKKMKKKVVASLH